MTRITNFARKRTYVQAGFPPLSQEQPSKPPKKRRLIDEVDRKSHSKTPNIVQSERRRLKRIADKRADLTCFACREQGHTAKDCRSQSNIGICYRCGSDPPQVFPDARNRQMQAIRSLSLHVLFAKNKERGIYPNGGCCNLCKATDHLAKNCKLRKEDIVTKPLIMGFAREAGADEDDFHVFKRSTSKVDKQEVTTLKTAQRQTTKPTPKKVVFF
ncbi:hypothetical protein DL96DRAFT_1709622 [Flagelloscypha sp. PMI_526]|nr:hypothetical protein DL96DRAFT_1709622 [Flagelloscypha sp. PMI_526]